MKQRAAGGDDISGRSDVPRSRSNGHGAPDTTPGPADAYRSLFEYSADGLLQMDPNGVIRAANPALQRLSGRSHDGLAGSSWRILVPSDEHASFLDCFRLAANGEPQDIIVRLVHENGSRVRTDVRLVPVFVDEQVTGVQALVRNRTSQPDGPNAQLVSEGRFKAIFDGTAIGAALVDISGRILAVNRAFAALAGCARDDLVGVRMVDLTHPDDRASNWGLFQEMIDGSRAHYHLETRYVRKDERAVWVNLTASVVRDGNGLAQFCVAMAEDVTDRKRLEQELREAQKMEAVGRLAGGIAHDFNNLLAVIQNYASFLAEDFDESDCRRHDAKEIMKAGDRAAALVRQLLTFSRRQAVDPQLIHINDIVVEMDKLLSRTIGEDIELRTDLDPGLWMTVIDPGGVEHIIANLAVNARDALVGGGAITIETINVEVDDDFAQKHIGMRSGRYVCLAVRDTGPGMTEAVAARVFEPFFTTKPSGEGSGLGLSTVYGIVEQAGGHIFVDSEPGAGTSFEAYLPAADREEGESDSCHARSEITGRGRVVLLAEDEPSVRAVIRRMLERNGFAVIGGDPNEAREIGKRPGGNVDVLLTDVIMPQLSGVELATEVLNHHGDCPVIFMSGYSENVLARHPIERPGAGFLAKPFTERELIGAVRVALGY